MPITPVTTLAVAAALAAPGAASAASIQTGVSAAEAHTAHADAALTRAVSLFKHGNDSLGTRQFAISQKQLGLAKAEAAKLQAQAHTPSAKARAAQAQIAVATQEKVSIEKLSALVPSAGGHVQNAIAQAARSDTTGQAKALAVLAAVELKAPAQAQPGLARAVEAISAATQREVSAEAHTATNSSDSTTSASTLIQAVKTAVSGQATASAKLAALVASSSTPAAALPGLQRAEINVANQEKVSTEQLSALVPDATGKVQNAIAQAALSDTSGQAKALTVLTAVELKAPAQAQAGLARAIEAISTATQREVSAEAKAAANNGDSTTSASTLAQAVKAAVSGQDTASAKLAALVASSSTPAAALPGLQKAYSEVTAQQSSIANLLSHLSPNMPASVRSFVSAIITQARTNASQMKNNRPAPPTGGRSGSHPTGGGTTTQPTTSSATSHPTASSTTSQPPSGGSGSDPTTGGSGAHPTASGRGSLATAVRGG